MSSNRHEFSVSELDSINPTLLYITQSEYGADWHSTPHFHPFLEILFVYEGQGTFIIDSRHCQLSAGDFAIIQPLISHTEKSNSNNPMKYFILGVDNMSLDIKRVDSANYNQLNDAEFFPVYHMPDFADKAKCALDKMTNELDGAQSYYDFMVHHQFCTFLIQLIRYTNLEITEIKINKQVTKETAFVKQYIDSHFALNITIDDLASKSFINKFHLIHFFTKACNVSPMQYLLHKRIIEAKALLRTTDLNITAIANNVGFSSPSHFTEKFKELEGTTPKSYRATAKNTPTVAP